MIKSINREYYFQNYNQLPAEPAVNLSVKEQNRYKRAYRIKEEIDVLRAIYQNRLIPFNLNFLHFYEYDIEIQPNFYNVNKEVNCYIVASFLYSNDYPEIIPKINLNNSYNISYSEKDVLLKQVLELMTEHSKKGLEMILDVCLILQSYVDKKNKELSSENSNKHMYQMKKTVGFKRTAKVDETSLVEHEQNQLFLGKLSELDLQKRQTSINISNINIDLKTDFLDEVYYNSHISRFNSDDFEILEKLGAGGEGVVFKVRNNNDGMIYAIKRIKIHIKNRQSTKDLFGEVMLLSRLHHANIVNYFHCWIEDYELHQEEDEEEEEEEDGEGQGEGNDDDSNNYPSDSEEITEMKFKGSYYSKKNGDKNKGKIGLKSCIGVDSDNSKQASIHGSHGNHDDSQDKSASSSSIKDTNRIETDLTRGISTNFIFEANSVKPNAAWESRDLDRLDKKRRSKTKKQNNENYKYLFIEMEFCEGQTLREMIDNQSFLDDNMKFQLIREILSALSYMHSKHVIHRDLKPSNILLGKNMQVKLGDFGLATLKGGSLESGVGTPHYMSPEQQEKEKYDEKSDMYSLGIIIFEMFYFFDSEMERSIVLKKIRESHSFPVKWEKTTPHNIFKLVNNLTQRDPTKRKLPLEILNSNLLPFHMSDNLVFINFKKIIKTDRKYANIFLKILQEKIFKESDSQVPRDSQISQSLFESKSEVDLKPAIQESQVSSRLVFFVVKKLKKVFSDLNCLLLNLPSIDSYYDKTPIMVKTDDHSYKVVYVDDNFKYLTFSFLNMKGTLQCSLRSQNASFSKFVRQCQLSLGKFMYISNSLSNSSDNESLLAKKEVVFNYLWRNTCENGITLNDDWEYEVQSFKAVHKAVTELKFERKLDLVINSTFILDALFDKIDIDMQTRGSVITLLQSNRQKKTRLNKLFLENLKHIQPQKIYEMISFFNVKGDLANVKLIVGKDYKKYTGLTSEINKLEKIFSNPEVINELSVTFNVNFDFSLTPREMVNYSGIFFEICSPQSQSPFQLSLPHKQNSGMSTPWLDFPVCYGGRIDNFLNPSSSFKLSEDDLLKGFSAVFQVDAILEQYLSNDSVTLTKNDQFEQETKADVLLVTMDEFVKSGSIDKKEAITSIATSSAKKASSELELEQELESEFYRLKDGIKQSKLSVEALLKPLDNTNDYSLAFTNLFKIYKMKMLLILKKKQRTYKIIRVYRDYRLDKSDKKKFELIIDEFMREEFKVTRDIKLVLGYKG